MRGGRFILVVVTMVAILVSPLLLRDAILASQLPSAYAASSAFDVGGRVYQNGNNNDNDDNDDGDDDDDNDNNGDDDGGDNDNNGDDGDNDNEVCYANINSNEEVPCDFDDNDNDFFEPAPGPAPVRGFVPPTRRCFDVQEVGDIRLILEGGSITVQVVPPTGFPQVTWVELDDVDPGTVPALPGALLDSLIFRVEGGSPCDGPVAGQLPAAVNLGIPYHVSADKSRLQIVRLEGGQWVNVDTVPDPDPGNPYISATIQSTGVYAVIQR